MAGRFELKKYTSVHVNDILSSIGQDPDWDFLTCSDTNRINYTNRLEQSITYVCYSEDRFCGYVRGILDQGMAVYISELFVKPEYRNNRIAQKLIEIVKSDYGSLTVYALSDEDAFYEKKGYRKIGSVFEI